MVESKQQWKAWLYLAPAIVLLMIFTVWPIINTVRIAFLDNYSALSAAGGETYTIGVKNFTDTIFNNPDFSAALKNTLLLTVLTVPISTVQASRG